jgi:hypothetical protein
LSRRSFLLPAIAVALFTASAAPALADAHSTPPSDTCFYARELQSWKSPAPDVILMRVGASQVFRLDLETGSNQLKYSDVRLVNRHQTSAWICSPQDLDLLLVAQGGFSEPLFVKSITRLTPDEVAAIPHQFQP